VHALLLILFLSDTYGGRVHDKPTVEQQRANQALHHRRLRIEHVNSSVKRCRVVKDRIRLWKEGVRDVVMEICSDFSVS
jgi:hypothetical protein